MTKYNNNIIFIYSYIFDNINSIYKNIYLIFIFFIYFRYFSRYIAISLLLNKILLEGDARGKKK